MPSFMMTGFGALGAFSPDGPVYLLFAFVSRANLYYSLQAASVQERRLERSFSWAEKRAVGSPDQLIDSRFWMVGRDWLQL
jgi:hypothetical protein